MQSHAVTTTSAPVEQHTITTTEPAASYSALILRDGCIRDVALNRAAAKSLSITLIPVDELQGTPCAVVVPSSDLNWWAICCASLRDKGLIVQPFVKREHACTWLSFMQAARPT